jgi:hypothetical protein
MTPELYGEFMNLLEANLNHYHPIIKDHMQQCFVASMSRASRLFGAWWEHVDLLRKKSIMGCLPDTPFIRQHLRQEPRMEASTTPSTMHHSHHDHPHLSPTRKPLRRVDLSMSSPDDNVIHDAQRRRLKRIGRKIDIMNPYSNEETIDEMQSNVSELSAIEKDDISTPAATTPDHQEACSRTSSSSFARPSRRKIMNRTMISRIRNINRATMILWLAMAVSIAFATYGVSAWAMSMALDFALWQQRVALSRYRNEIEKSYLAINQATLTVKAVIQESQGRVVATEKEWKGAKEIDRAWQEITQAVSLPRHVE